MDHAHLGPQECSCRSLFGRASLPVGAAPRPRTPGTLQLERGLAGKRRVESNVIVGARPTDRIFAYSQCGEGDEGRAAQPGSLLARKLTHTNARAQRARPRRPPARLTRDGSRSAIAFTEIRRQRLDEQVEKYSRGTPTSDDRHCRKQKSSSFTSTRYKLSTKSMLRKYPPPSRNRTLAIHASSNSRSLSLVSFQSTAI